MTTPHTDQLVARAGRSLFLAEAARLILRAVVVLVLSLAAAVLIDAGYALTTLGLIALDIVLLIVMIYTLRPLCMLLFQGSADNRQTALYIEQRLSIPDNQIINTLELARQDDKATSASLRAEAIAIGESTAQTISGRSIIDRDALWRAVKPALASIIGLMLAYLLVPSVFHAVLPRMALPFADLPPFTFVQFDVQTRPDPIYFGKSATIHARLSGSNIPDQAQVVFIDEGIKSPPLPMYRISSQLESEADPDSAHQYALRIERVESPRRFYITTPNGRSSTHTLAADTSPLIERTSAAYDYPDYTGWPDTNGPLPTSGIRALAGTHITLHVESNVPLNGGTLHIVPKNIDAAKPDSLLELTPDPSDARSASVRFPLDTTGRFELTLLGADGKPGVETLQGNMSALPDRAPKIDITHPEQQAVVPEGWPVDAQITAGDDIGLDSVVIHIGVNDKPTSPARLEVNYTDINRTVAQSAHTLDLAQLGAHAGDTLRYYAAARDNHPASPQSTETPVHAIHIITMQQYLDLARTQYRIDDLNREFDAILDRLADLETQRNQLLDELTELQEMLDAGESLSDAQRQRLAALEAALNKYAQQASALADELKQRTEQATLYDFEESYKQMLNDLATQLQEQGDQAQSLADVLESLQQDDTQARRSAAGFQSDRFALLDKPFTSDTHEQTEAAEQDLEKLSLSEAMLAQGERIRRIALQQDELAVRLSGLSEPHNMSAEQRARAESLAGEQGALRDELAEASEALREAAEQASEALPCMSGGALSVVDKIDSLGIVPTQTAAEKASLAHNGPLAHQAAREAAEKLDSLLSDVSQGPAQASNDLDGCFKLPRQQLQNTLQQMAAGRGLPSMGTQGGSGSGMAGASARMSMMGPSLPGQPGADSPAEAGRRGGQGGRGRSVSVNEDPGDPAEVIHANANQRTGHAVSRFPGVPAEYREQAAAYFKRIAEEQQ